MNLLLNNEEIRVLGCLMEKEMATPEYYPLTLNALLNACNQKTNREPVVVYDEETVLAATEELRSKKFIRQSTIGRAQKFEQIFADTQNLIARETAILCLLLLRGPQTMGEIRGRSDRLYPFADLDEVRHALDSLEEVALVRQLPRQPGQKEARYGHLLAGELLTAPGQTTSATDTAVRIDSGSDERCDQLQEQIDGLKLEVELLRQELAAFRKQFD